VTEEEYLQLKAEYFQLIEQWAAEFDETAVHYTEDELNSIYNDAYFDAIEHGGSWLSPPNHDTNPDKMSRLAGES